MARNWKTWTSIPFELRYAFVALAIAWFVVALGGGSSRADMIQLVPVRIVTAFCLSAFLLLVPVRALRPVRAPLLFLMAAATLVGLQLVPLPYALWSSLPGREIYAEVAQAAGLRDIWHPLTLSPDLTWNSLLALVTPAVFVCAAAVANAEMRRTVLLALLVTILLSGLLGLLQVAAGPSTPLRFYRISNLDAGVGLFANRNHQAVFLAMGIPLAGWLGLRTTDRRRRAIGIAMTVSCILFLLVSILASQSRTGSAIAFISLLLTGLALVPAATWKSRPGILSLLAIGTVTVALAVAILRRWSDGRLGQLGLSEDLRVRIFPETVEAMRTFFPVGSGFGTFPQVFPRFEATDDLQPEYFNHTHVEPTQILIEGGIVAALLAAALLGWYLLASWRAWRKKPARSDEAMEARVYSILVALPLLGSLTDYPLRTPLMLCAWGFLAAALHVRVSNASARAENQKA